MKLVEVKREGLMLISYGKTIFPVSAFELRCSLEKRQVLHLRLAFKSIDMTMISGECCIEVVQFQNTLNECIEQLERKKALKRFDHKKNTSISRALFSVIEETMSERGVAAGVSIDEKLVSVIEMDIPIRASLKSAKESGYGMAFYVEESKSKG